MKLQHKLAAAIAGMILVCASAASAQIKPIWNFGLFLSGSSPEAELAMDQDGNLYGVSTSGGPVPSNGAVYELKKPANPAWGWTRSTIFGFGSRANPVTPHSGSYPLAGLVIDSNGTLYGTTAYGGLHDQGVIYHLTPPTTRTAPWAETILHTFSGPEGAKPYSRLIMDSAGALYGSTLEGGGPDCIFGCGSIFKLTPLQNGGWTQSVLYYFTGQQDGKSSPFRLVMDGSGAIYGVTQHGGDNSNPLCYDHIINYGCGTVFKLQQVAGKWVETTLYTFHNGPDGSGPAGALTIDANGNLYGISAANTGNGTGSGTGIAYELSPTGSGGYTFSIIHNFDSGDAANGLTPSSDLLLQSDGSLLGTTQWGGQFAAGTIYRLTPPSLAGGPWSETVLGSFDRTKDGAVPISGLIPGPDGTYFGTTISGGRFNQGTVYQFSP